MKVAEPQILAKLQKELLTPTALAYVTKGVQKALKTIESASAGGGDKIRRELDQEKRKL